MTNPASTAGTRAAAVKSRHAHTDDADEAKARVLEKGLDPSNQQIVRGFEKNVAKERWRREAREVTGIEIDQGGSNPEDALAEFLDQKNAQKDRENWRSKRRTKTQRVHSRGELVAYACALLGDRIGRKWKNADTAQLRGAVGVDEGPLPDFIDNHGRRRRLTVREAVVTEVAAHRFLGPIDWTRPRELAAACILCGDGDVSAKRYEQGVLPGEIIDDIAKGLAHHRAAQPATAQAPKGRRVRRKA